MEEALLNRDGLVGENVSLGGWELRFQKSNPGSVALSVALLLPVDLDGGLSATSLVPGLPASCHASYHEIDYTSET